MVGKRHIKNGTIRMDGAYGQGHARQERSSELAYLALFIEIEYNQVWVLCFAISYLYSRSLECGHICTRAEGQNYFLLKLQNGVSEGLGILQSPKKESRLSVNKQSCV